MNRRGFTLLEIVVGTAIMLLIFVALIGILRASLLVSTLAKAKATATAVAQTQMEYLRGLSYDSLGTVGGIPSGTIAQTASTTLNGITYTTTTFIQYVDDPADGLGASDTDGVTTDYKRARVSVSYLVSSKPQSVVLVSNFAPPGLETSNGGGTLEINVVNSSGAPVAGATVGVVNSALSPSVNLTAYSDASGEVVLPGAATSSEYQISVTKSGYSSAQTYARAGQNQNPTPGYLTVAANQTTVGTFAIDLLTTFNLATYSPIATSTFADAFADTSKLSSMSSTTVASGLTLTSGATTGSARSNPIAPSYLAQWGTFSATSSTPGGSSVLLHVYDGSGSLIPDAAVPGNAAGLASPVHLFALSTTTYPSLEIGADLASSASAPTISAWSLSYAAGPTPLPNVAFTLTGAKTIGSTNAGAPLYKTTVSGSTNGSGLFSQSLEWDSYSLSLTGYDIADTCPALPYALAAGSTANASLYLSAATANSLRVSVTDSVGNTVSGASVTLSRTGYTATLSSSSCGNAYFGSLTSATDYSVTIAKSGYTTQTFSNVSVSGMSAYSASFP